MTLVPTAIVSRRDQLVSGEQGMKARKRWYYVGVYEYQGGLIFDYVRRSYFRAWSKKAAQKMADAEERLLKPCSMAHFPFVSRGFRTRAQARVHVASVWLEE